MVTVPLGWTDPYSSITANVAVPGLTPEVVSVIVPEIVTGTILPLGGHNVLGFGTSVIVGGVESILIVSALGLSWFPDGSVL
jgi:hypothetical protein